MSTFQKSMVAGSIVISVCIGISIIVATVFLVDDFDSVLSLFGLGSQPDFSFGESRIIVGEGQFQREPFFAKVGMGVVSDIVVLESSGLTIVSSEGAYELDSSLSVVSSIEFEGEPLHAKRIDIDSDGVFEYIDLSEYAPGPGVYNNSGKHVAPPDSFDDVYMYVPCDIDADGNIEYLIAGFDMDNVALWDSKGDVIWERSENIVTCMRCGDLDGDGQSEIVHIGATRGITVRDASGSIVSKISLANYATNFEFTTWPNREGDLHILLQDFYTFNVIDGHGVTVVELPAEVMV